MVNNDRNRNFVLGVGLILGLIIINILLYVAVNTTKLDSIFGYGAFKDGYYEYSNVEKFSGGYAIRGTGTENLYQLTNEHTISKDNNKNIVIIPVKIYHNKDNWDYEFDSYKFNRVGTKDIVTFSITDLYGGIQNHRINLSNISTYGYVNYEMADTRDTVVIYKYEDKKLLIFSNKKLYDKYKSDYEKYMNKY